LIDELESAIRETAANDERAKLLDTIPGRYCALFCSIAAVARKIVVYAYWILKKNVTYKELILGQN